MLILSIAAVTTDEAASSLVEWVDQLDISKTGEYWAPRGPGQLAIYHLEVKRTASLINAIGDIGTAEATLGKGLPTPLKLPW